MPPKQLKTDSAQVDAVWSKIEAALKDVNAIVSGEKSSMQSGSLETKMNWYTHIYNAATKDQKMSEILYKKLREWIEADLLSRVTRRAKSFAEAGADAEGLFRYVAKAYEDFKIAQKFGQLSFRYLDDYLTQKSGYVKINRLYLQAFHKAVYEQVKSDLMTVILRQVSSRREGNQVDMNALRSAMEVFTNVGTSVTSVATEMEQIYQADCEQHYLAALNRAYEARALVELNKDGGHYTYLQWVESRFALEQGMATTLLRPSSLEKVIDSLDRQCVRNQMKVVILHSDSGFATLLEDWKEADLARMFKIFKRVPEKEAIKLMAVELQKRVITEGSSFMAAFRSADGADGGLQVDRTLVENCLQLHEKYKRLISTHFDNEIEMQEAQRKGFETFVNEKLTRKEVRPGSTEPVVKETTFPEVLSSYVDAVLRREFKDIVDPDAELERIDRIVNLFSFIKEKDIFQEFSKAKLAKRLLQTTPIEDLERAFLEKLQRMMGSGFTHKMEGMLHDRDNTKLIGDQFLADSAGKSLPCEFAAQVLTAGHWPAYKSDGLEPHASLRQCMQAFTLFYKKRYATRNLNWIHMLGSSTLAIAFPKGPKDVTGSTYQASILCLVDDFGTISGKQIAEHMKVDFAKLVKPNLASLYLSKQFPLLVAVDDAGADLPTGKTVQETDRFRLHSAFQFKIRKFKLTAPQAVASQGMPEASDIDARRKTMIDACVVRVMKSRRVLSYTELVDACVAQLAKYFVPQPKHIKLRIEDLITRQYLKRDPSDPAKFEYLA